MMDPELLDRYPWIEELSLDGGSILEMEFTHGALMQHTPNITFYRRIGDEDGEDRARLDALVKRIETNGYPIRSFTTVEELGDLVRNDLINLINERWTPNELPSPAESERMMHRAFAHSRQRAYIPIPTNTAAFTNWIETGTSPLLVCAESGMGKSAFMAWAEAEYHRKNPAGFAIAHYVGTSDNSTDHHGIIRRIITEIQERCGLSVELPTNGDELSSSLVEWLARLSANSTDSPSLILIDALDQLSEHSRSLEWLPHSVPENIRLIVSCRNSDVLERLHSFGWEELTLRPLSVREREAIVTRYLAEYHKSLPSDILDRIGNDEKSSSPLFLRTLAEELRLYGEHESLAEYVNRYLAVDDLEDLFVQLLERMESDYGERIVRSVTTSLALSRSGLTEHHLLRAANVVRVELSMLLHALDYHLLRTGGRINYFHNFLKRAVEKRYLATTQLRRDGHSRLADVFNSDLNVMDTHTDPAALREMLYQLMNADRRDDLRAALTSAVVFDALYTDETEYEYLRYLRWLAESDITSLYQHLINNDPHRSLRLAKLFRALGKWDDAQAVLENTIRAREHDARRQIQLYGALGSLQQLLGDPTSALASFEQKRDAARSLGDDRAEAEADGDIGTIYFDHGNLDEALKRFRSMLLIARAYNDKRSEANALTKIGQIESQRGDRKSAMHSFGEALRLVESSGDLRESAFVLGQIGLVHWNSGAFADAMKCFLRETEAMDAIGDRLGEAQAVGKIGLVLLDEGRLDEAESSFRSYLERTQSLGYARGIGFAQGDLGIVELRRHRHNEALQYFHDALETHKRIEFIYGIALWQKWIAETLIERGEEQDILRAKEHNDESALIAQNIGSDDILFDTEINNARIAASSGLDPAAYLAALLQKYTQDHQQASVQYWMWKLLNVAAARETAVGLYRDLSDQTHKAIYLRRRDELSG